MKPWAASLLDNENHDLLDSELVRAESRGQARRIAIEMFEGKLGRKLKDYPAGTGSYVIVESIMDMATSWDLVHGKLRRKLDAR